jgi:aryl-alcohol dehydrogenase-like predicted oxidoreductase
VRVLLSLCADRSGTTEGGSPVSAFVTDAFAAAAGGDDGDGGENGDAGETPFFKPLTRARAARILEKYRDVPLGKGADPSATAFAFASKKRVDAVVKVLKAR